MEYPKCDLCNNLTNEMDNFSCEHKTCKDCFYKICLLNKQGIETFSYHPDKQINLKCTICPTGTITLKKPLLRQHLIQNSEKNRTEKQKLCDFHKKELSVYCSVCRISMCPECFKSHKNVRMFKSHVPGKNPVIPSLLSNTCVLHDNRPFHYFCTKCNVALCEMCRSSHKKDHKMRSLQKFYNKQKEEFMDDFVLPSHSIEEIFMQLDESDLRLKEQLGKEVTGIKERTHSIIEFLSQTLVRVQREFKLICDEIDNNNAINKILYTNLLRDLENVYKSTEFDINCQYLIRIPRENSISKREITNEIITEAIYEMSNSIEKYNKNICNNSNILIDHIYPEIIQKRGAISDTESVAISFINTKDLMSQVKDLDFVSQLNGKIYSPSRITEKEWHPHGDIQAKSIKLKSVKESPLSLVQTITGLGSVYSVIQLKDGRLATCSSDKTIRIWNPDENFVCTHTLKGHTYSVSSLIEFQDGRIASCSGDKTIRIWDPTDNFNCSETLTGHTFLVYSLIQLKDGRLASGSFDNSVKIWDPLDHFKCCLTLTGHKNLVYSLVQLKNGAIASGSRDNTIKIWDYYDDFKCIHSLKGHTDSVKILIQLNNGSIASGSWDNTIRIWDPQDNYNCTNVLTGHNSSVYSLIQLSDGRVASGSLDNTIRLWDPEDSFICVQTLTGHKDSVSCITQIHDGRLISGSWDNTIRVWK